MKKIYLILGNKPFEDKIVEQLSKIYWHAGSAIEANEQASMDIVSNAVDALIVRESLFDSQDAFLVFIESLKKTLPTLKIVAILKNYPIGDEFLYRVIEGGVFDIINGGTRLAEVIEFASRESSFENVKKLIDAEQIEMITKKQSAVTKEETEINEDEDIAIELGGVLTSGLEDKSGFKERFSMGMTQVSSYSTETEEEEANSPSFINSAQTLRHLIDEAVSVGSIFDGESFEVIDKDNQENEIKEDATKECQKEQEDDVLLLTRESTPSPVSPEAKVNKIPEQQKTTEYPLVDKKSEITSRVGIRRIAYITSHSLLSSIALQMAVEMSYAKKVVYVETDARNLVLGEAAQKKGVRFVDATKGLDMNLVESEWASDTSIVIVNLNQKSNTMNKIDTTIFEILQDKREAEEVSAVTKKDNNARVVISYFDQHLLSIKNINKIIGCKSFKYPNTRVEEYNARLNGNILASQTIKEIVEGA